MHAGYPTNVLALPIGTETSSGPSTDYALSTIRWARTRYASAPTFAA